MLFPGGENGISHSEPYTHVNLYQMVSGYRLIQERDPHFPYCDLESSIKDDQKATRK